jgi:hypothetical protein
LGGGGVLEWERAGAGGTEHDAGACGGVHADVAVAVAVDVHVAIYDHGYAYHYNSSRAGS